MPHSRQSSRSRQREFRLQLPGLHGQFVPAVEVTRGPIVDAVHAAAIAVADASGRVVARLGGVDHVVYLRSSAKPLQAMAVVESGAADRFGLTDREIAVMTGSHSSEPDHVETVAGILGKIGVDAGALQCGTHVPFSREVADEYRRTGRPFTPLEHNCSGKHAGMIAAALAGGHDPGAYLDPSHPVQQRVAGIVADLTGRMRDRLIIGVDGCGAPTFGVSLAEAARAFARLVSTDVLPAGHREAAARVVAAMRKHPGMVAGRGMTDTQLTAYPRRTLVSKRGAEGLQCLAFVDGDTGGGGAGGVGVAAKIADGDSGRARVALVAGILSQLEVTSNGDLGPLFEAETLVVRNNSGREVGVVRPAFTLQRV